MPSNDTNPIRAFIAVDIGQDVRRRLLEVQERLRQTTGDVRWVRPESIHLTLRFLGNIEPDKLQILEEVLGQAIEGIKSTEVEVIGLGAFPNARRPRVIWAGIRGGEVLFELANRLEKKLLETGFGPADKPFRPHLTLGRVSSLRGMGRLMSEVEAAAEEKIGGFTVSGLRLYQSRLQPKGAIYTVLVEHPLGS